MIKLFYQIKTQFRMGWNSNKQKSKQKPMILKWRKTEIHI